MEDTVVEFPFALIILDLFGMFVAFWVANKGGQKLFLLVVITEQIQYLGAVQHIKHSNLILYVCKPGQGAKTRPPVVCWSQR